MSASQITVLSPFDEAVLLQYTPRPAPTIAQFHAYLSSRVQAREPWSIFRSDDEGILYTVPALDENDQENLVTGGTFVVLSKKDKQAIHVRTHPKALPVADIKYRSFDWSASIDSPASESSSSPSISTSSSDGEEDDDDEEGAEPYQHFDLSDYNAWGTPLGPDQPLSRLELEVGKRLEKALQTSRGDSDEDEEDNVDELEFQKSMSQMWRAPRLVSVRGRARN